MSAKIQKIIYVIFGKFGCIPTLDSDVNALVQATILAQSEGIDILDIINFTKKYKNMYGFGVIYN